MIRKIAVLLGLAFLLDALFLLFWWINHEFVTGLNPFLGFVLVLLTLVIGIPLAVIFTRRLLRFCDRQCLFDGSNDNTILFFTGVYFFYPRWIGRPLNAKMAYTHDFAFIVAALVLIAQLLFIFNLIYSATRRRI